EDGVLEAVAAALDRALAAVHEVEHVVHEGRAGERPAIVVGGSPGQVETAGRAGDAGVEQVALAGGGVGSPERRQPEASAAILAEQGIARRGGGELALAEPGAEEVAGGARARLLGAEDAHAPLGGAAPKRHAGAPDCLDRVRERRRRAAGERAGRRQ